MEMSIFHAATHRSPSSSVQQLQAAPGDQRVLRHVGVPQRQPAPHVPRTSTGQEVSVAIPTSFVVKLPYRVSQKGFSYSMSPSPQQFCVPPFLTRMSTYQKTIEGAKTHSW